MSYRPRALSPGSQRIQNPARASDNLGPYYAQRHNSYVSPRSSQDRVIPISTQTFVNVPSAGGTTISRPTERFESYSGRPRRSSLVDSGRGSTSTAQPPSRSRPNVVQGEFARPASPLNKTREYYVQPASSKEPKEPRKFEHKKVYSVNDGSANLVADLDIPTAGPRHHKRRDSETRERPVERGGYRSSAYAGDRDVDRGRESRVKYHANGPPVIKANKNIDDDDAFSYTDPARMYAETEPRWREREVRPRRGSVDRGGASRERPVSMLEPSTVYGGDPRRSNRDIGPPPSARGWDKLNEGLGRARSVRDTVPRSPSRGRGDEPVAYADAKDPYYVPPRRNSVDRGARTAAVHQDRPTERGYDPYGSDFEEPRQPRRERRLSASRPKDPSLERRGFGIRPESKDRYGRGESKDRYGPPPRGSDESFERRQRDLARDSGYAEEPHRRDTAPELFQREQDRKKYHDAGEQYNRERMPPPDRLPNEERDRPYEPPREPRDKEYRRRDERTYDDQLDRERDRPKERDRERDRDFDKKRDRDDDRDRERHHHRRETADRDYDRGPKESGDSISGATLAAGTGLAGAAAAYGIKKHNDRKKEDDREREPEPERQRDRERQPEPDRIPERVPRFEDDYEKPRESRRHRAPEPYPEDIPFQRPQEQKDPYTDPDRGLGFAFEALEPPKPPREPQRAPEPQRDYVPERERAQERDISRPQEPSIPAPHAAQMPKPAIDPDEDYRRRMEQVQRELGRGSDDRQSSDSDPDRERRRREREERRAARSERLNMPTMPNGGFDAGVNDQPPSAGRKRSIENESDLSRHGNNLRPNGGVGVGISEQPPAAGLRRSFDNESDFSRHSNNTRSTGGLGVGVNDQPPTAGLRRSFENESDFSRHSNNTRSDYAESSLPSRSEVRADDIPLRRKSSILDRPMTDEPSQMAQIIDNSMSEKRENRVRIVDPPTEEEERRPKGILKKPTQKFPEDPNAIREGVAPLKDVRLSAQKPC